MGRLQGSVGGSALIPAARWRGLRWVGWVMENVVSTITTTITITTTTANVLYYYCTTTAPPTPTTTTNMVVVVVVCTSKGMQTHQGFSLAAQKFKV